VSLSGGTGGGLAVPVAAAPRASADVGPAKPVQRTTKVLAAALAPEETCSEPPKKPKVLTIAQPTYTRAARDAEIAGRVRVEVTVDATGRVSATRVLEGLGYGLDEEALAAAKNATFEPGTRCGHAAAATFVVAMRFSL
jgi:protein TonB